MACTPNHPRHEPMTGVVAGLLAGVATGVTDKLLGRFVSKEQKRRDRAVREGRPHEVAGPLFAERITGHKPGEQEAKLASAIFTIVYGIGWGLAYAPIRRRYPRLFRTAALPFGVLFFAGCDGLLAPLAGMSPPLWKIPWQMNVKEMGNHCAWSASAEMVHRAAARYGL